MHVVICDGNRILGEALAAALEACDHEVTAVATSTADDCIASITRNEAEVCVLDPHLPEVPDCLAGHQEAPDRAASTRSRWPPR